MEYVLLKQELSMLLEGIELKMIMKPHLQTQIVFKAIQ